MRLVAFPLCLLLGALSTARLSAQSTATDEAPWRIYDTRAGEEIALPDLISSLGVADVIFFGEMHDDSLAHVLEDTIYGALLRRYGDVALSLEMFETDVQPVVDEYLARLIALDLLVADTRAWEDYVTAYHPMVERAKAANQAVVAANAPRRYVRVVGQRGAEVYAQFPETARAFLPDRPWRHVDTAYLARFNGLMGAVPGHDEPTGERGTDPADLSPMFAAQMLWDATMADSIHEQWRRGGRGRTKVFHVNGSFHSDYRQGTVSQLAMLRGRRETRVLTKVIVDDLTRVDWGEYAELADYVIAGSSEP